MGAESYFTKEQLAKYLKMTEKAVDHLVKSGQIPSIQTPKGIVIFKKSDIDNWLSEKKKKLQKMFESEETA